MKGSNVIKLNQATMIQALEEYFARVMPEVRPRVESVKPTKEGLTDDFAVVLVVDDK